jgi:hypothetical protein
MEEDIKPGYTRVTEMLSPWNNFDGIPAEILEAKRVLGTEVHELIRMFNECIPLVVVSGKKAPYFQSFLSWMLETKVSVRQNEVRLYDDQLMITGQIDALVKFPEKDDLIILDWKTSASYNKKTGLSWALQGVFYHYLLTQNSTSNLSNTIMFVQLSSKGEMPKIREFEYSTELMRKGTAVLEAYRYFNPPTNEG